MPSDDAFDLGIDPEHRFETELWRPSQDYPEVTVHRLRRAGDVLEIESSPPFATPYVRRARIVAVHRHLGLAELAFDGGMAELFDLGQRRPTTERSFRVTVPVTRDVRSPELWLDVLEGLAREMPALRPIFSSRTFDRAELDSLTWTVRGDERVAEQRFPAPSSVPPDDVSWMAKQFGLPPAPPPIPGYSIVRRIVPTGEAVSFHAMEASPLVTVNVGLDADGSRASIVGYLTPDVARLDESVGRLRALLLT